MAATELNSVADLVVESAQRAPNQAMTLTAFHTVKVDDVAALEEGDEVKYTDTDLGYVFHGRITRAQKAYRNGEGVRYTCADAYRTLAKQAAIIDIPSGGRSTRIELQPGASMNDSLAAIFSGSRLSTILPGGLSNALVDKTLPMTDRGGQTVDSWIDELVKQTSDGIAYVQPNAGSPRLRIRTYSSAGDITLTQGTYSVINPSSGELVLENGDLGGSLDRKYKRVTCEGCGEFTRHELRFIPASEVTKVSDYEYRFKYYLPDTPAKRVLCRYIDPDTGECGDRCAVRVRLGQDDVDISLGQSLWEYDNPEFTVEADGKVAFFVIVYLGGIYGASDTPAVPNISAWFTYTTWDAGLMATVESSDPKLNGEGEYVEQHDEYVKYTGPGISVDQTSLLTTLATNLAARFSGSADQAGTMRVHVKGINANLDLGSRITNFGNCRVQSISYDFVARSMSLSITDVPLRAAIELAKQDSQVRTLPGNNWIQNRKKYTSNCFCISRNDVTSVDDAGQPPGGGGGGGTIPKNPGNPIPPATWDCNEWTRDCVERKDGGGRYKTLGDCRRECVKGGWKHVPCVGCQPTTDAQAQYDTLTACDSAHPAGSPYNAKDYTNCKYRCDPGNECVAGKTGPYATLAACKSNCTDSGSGYGGSSGVEDPPPAPDPNSGSNPPQTIEVLIDAVCNSTTKQIDKTYATITLR